MNQCVKFTFMLSICKYFSNLKSSFFVFFFLDKSLLLRLSRRRTRPLSKTVIFFCDNKYFGGFFYVKICAWNFFLRKNFAQIFFAKTFGSRNPPQNMFKINDKNCTSTASVNVILGFVHIFKSGTESVFIKTSCFYYK